MYKIEQKEYGYHITLEGLIKLEEMERIWSLCRYEIFETNTS